MSGGPSGCGEHDDGRGQSLPARTWRPTPCPSTRRCGPAVPWPPSRASAAARGSSVDYEDVRHVLRHPEIFSSDIVAVDIGQDRPLIPLQVDPPEHAKYRRVIDPTLGPDEVAPLEDEVRALVNELIDGFIDRGAVDAHAEFTVPLPCTVFLQLCGLPARGPGPVPRVEGRHHPPGHRRPRGSAAAIRRATGAEMYAYFGEALDEREGAGGYRPAQSVLHLRGRRPPDVARGDARHLLPVHPRWPRHGDLHPRLLAGLPGRAPGASPGPGGRPDAGAGSGRGVAAAPHPGDAGAAGRRPADRAPRRERWSPATRSW